MNVLIACEESQAVTIEMRELGINAFSCDIEPCSGGHPEWHIQEDVYPSVNEKKWDMIISFPPCTHIAVSGAKHFEQKRKDGRQQQGIDFFMKFVESRCPKVAIENPIGIMSTVYRKPDQIIQPYQFGDPFTKTTCLWLKGLPLLKPTKLVDKGKMYITRDGRNFPDWLANAKIKDRAKIRSKTFPGISKAMASQWGSLLLPPYQ